MAEGLVGREIEVDGVKVKIISARPFMDITPEGKFIKIWRVEYIIGGKIRDWLDIPAVEFEVDKVLEKVKETAKKVISLLKPSPKTE